MNDLYYLMECFGDRYINVTKQEAAYNLEHCREEMVGAYNALTEYVRIMKRRE